MQDQFSRKNSGSPGYIKGLPVKTGTLVIPEQNPTQAYLKEPMQAFPLLGGDNKGQCYTVKDSIVTTVKNEDKAFKMADFSDLRYYEDPSLTFEDSILTGCHLDMNRQELQDFCLNKKFQNLVIF